MFHPTMHERQLIRSGRIVKALRSVAKRKGVENREALRLVRSTREYRMECSRVARVRSVGRMVDFVSDLTADPEAS